MAAIDLTGIEWVWVDLDDTLWDFSGNSLISLAKIYDMHDLHRFYPTMEQWRNRYLEETTRCGLAITSELFLKTTSSTNASPVL